jgi:2-polyprenyl-6-methoxyphenol hydroxylase-like FAD-dependent oxidoreductase
MTGMGTSLAILGAYVLAGELASHARLEDGLAGYERVLRPYVDKAQKLPLGGKRLTLTDSPAGLAVFHGLARGMGAVASVVRFFSPSPPRKAQEGEEESKEKRERAPVVDEHGFQLPDYSKYYARH